MSATAAANPRRRGGVAAIAVVTLVVMWLLDAWPDAADLPADHIPDAGERLDAAATATTTAAMSAAEMCLPCAPAGPGTMFCPIASTRLLSACASGSSEGSANEASISAEQSAALFVRMGSLVAARERDVSPSAQAIRGAEEDRQLVEFLRNDLCRTTNPTKHMDSWPAGSWLRAAGHVARALDCRPRAPAPLACPPPLPTSEPPHRRLAALDLEAASVPLSSAPAALQTEYSRRGRAAWIAVRNVCATCELEPAFFMNPARRCHLTLWSLNSRVDQLGPPSRKGRHSIFFEREGAFQYGGCVQRGDLEARGARYVRGTTIINAPMAIDNVGHQLHDGHWAFHALLRVRGDAGLPRPHRVLQDADYANFTGKYLAYLNTVVAASEVGQDGIVLSPLPQSPGRHTSSCGSFTSGNRSTGGNAGTHRGGSTGGDMLCFEALAVSGADRSGNNGGFKSGRRWAVAGNLRRVLLRDALGIAPEVSDGHTLHPTIAVYGRKDVHRRSIDNFGALVMVVQEVALSLGLPPPQLISTFNLTPQQQIALIAGVDVLVSVQGAHLQHSVFMPRDAVIYEICPCFAKRTSFLARYGVFLPLQRHQQLQLCFPMINFSGDKYAQNLTLCPRHLALVRRDLEAAVVGLLQRRRERFAKG